MQLKKRRSELVQVCNGLLNKFNELTEQETVLLTKSLTDLHRLNELTLDELEKANEKNSVAIEAVKEQALALETELLLCEAFIADKGLNKEFDKFVENTIEEVFPKNAPILKMVH